MIGSAGDLPFEVDSCWHLDAVSEATRQVIEQRVTAVKDFDKLPEDARGVAVGPPMHSALYVPLVHREAVVGLVAVDDPGSSRVVPPGRQIDLVEAIGAQAAVAVENARLFEAEVAAQRQLKAELLEHRLLQNVAVAATTQMSLEDVAQRSLSAIVESLGLKVGTVLVYTHEERMLTLLAWHGPAGSSDRFRELPSPMTAGRSSRGRSSPATS